MKRFFELITLLLFLASPLCADELGDCYRLLSDEKNSPDNILEKIVILEKSPSKIIEAVRSSSDRITDKYRFYRTAADLAHMSGDLRSAGEFYEKAYGVRPKSYEELYLAGVIYTETGDWDQAGKMFGIVSSEDKGIYGKKAEVMNGSVLISKGETAAGTAFLESVLVSSSDSSVLYLVYDVASAHKLEDLKAEALKKIGKNSFEGKLVSGGTEFPVTPSRIFTDHVVLDNRNDAVKADTEVASAEEDKTVSRPSAIQVGAFGKLTNAEVMQSKLKSLGLNSKKIDSGTGIYKVLIPVDPAMDVNNATLLLKDNNIEIMPIYD